MSSGQRTGKELLELGTRRSQDATKVTLPAETLLRHMMVLGSSGSGKTVLSKIVVEECVLAGIPVIAIDPQGDLCSLALQPDPASLRKHNVSPERAEAFAQRADVVVFSPASRKAVPLCADPVNTDLLALPADERVRAISSIAAMLTSLLGYRLDSDEGEGLIAVLDAVLSDELRLGRFPTSLVQLTQRLESMGDEGWEPYTRYLSRGAIDKAMRKLARLDVGTRRLLFHEGLPVDIELLLGRGPSALPGRTRVSVIYLNTLTSQEEKDFFLAALCEQLYAWMLANPSPTPQLLFYIDEIAPFMPPVRKPMCKDSLAILYKQARKYGVCCLAATQNPGDVDYKAMAQFGTWALGRLTTRQDLKKVEPTIKALSPSEADTVLESMPGLSPGEFLLLSPDVFDGVVEMQSRWLLTAHETLDEARIAALTDARWRSRFEALERTRHVSLSPDKNPAPPIPAPILVEEVDETFDDEPSDGESAGDLLTRDLAGARPVDKSEPFQLRGLTSAALRKASNLFAADAMLPTEDPQRAALDEKLAPLMAHASLSAVEYAALAGVSEGLARNILKGLVAAQLAKVYKESRTHRFWAVYSGLRPDLGLNTPVRVVTNRVDESKIRDLAEKLRRKPLLGAIGSGEHVADWVLEHRFVWRVHFKERVQKAFFRRIFSSQKHDEVEDNLYVHHRTLAILTYQPGKGIGFEMQPNEIASAIPDLDGQVLFEERLPGELAIDEESWRTRASKEAILESFRSRFQAEPESVEPVFIPVWKVVLRDVKTARLRMVWVDGITEREINWT